MSIQLASLDAADMADANTVSLARKFVEASGADPDTLVQPGRPDIYGTGNGPAFAVDPSKAKPLWTFYIEAAGMALAMAQAEVRTAA